MGAIFIKVQKIPFMVGKETCPPPLCPVSEEAASLPATPQLPQRYQPDPLAPAPIQRHRGASVRFPELRVQVERPRGSHLYSLVNPVLGAR